MFLHSTRSHFKSVFSPFFSLGISILLNPPLGNSFLLEKVSFPLLSRASILGLRVATPIFWGGGRVWVAWRVSGGSLGSWTGREILLYLIMYMKYTYVRKCLLLTRNCIIWPEVALNGHFFAWKIDFFNCLKKLKFFGNLPVEIEILLTRIHDPQDSKSDSRRCCFPSLDFSVASSEIMLP